MVRHAANYAAILFGLTAVVAAILFFAGVR
jgi:hypothetical protein